MFFFTFSRVFSSGFLVPSDTANGRYDPWQGASAAGGALGTLGTLGTLDGTLTHLAAMATRRWWWKKITGDFMV